MKAMIEQYQSRFKSVLPEVVKYEGKLKSLNDWWGKITLIGKINSHNVASTILTDMQSTQDKFGDLQQKLIYNLLVEHLRKIILDDSSRAQVAVDILIRNLFERTADVGFLATDDDIRQFLSKPDTTADDQAIIVERLREYVKKYSVYDEIIILDSAGNVRAQLDQSNPLSTSQDPLIQETLNTSEEYIETFRASDLQPNLKRSLIYSCKITQSNSPSSANLGVLCLCFRFDNEMEGIFNRLMSADSTNYLMLLDAQGKIIASNRNDQFTIGEKLNVVDKPNIIMHKSRDFLANTAQSHGYQGFLGLGWSGHTMSPIDNVFIEGSENQEHEQSSSSDSDISSSNLYSKALKDIHKDSLHVNEDLRLVVLNGKITAAREEAAEFIPVLEAIKQIGEDTANIFDESISRLQDTVISSRMNDVQFLAELTVDIMDRNLYERANDCRWWALTSKFRELLANPPITADASHQMSAILTYINNLYTVYTNLYLYDKDSKIVAVSNPKESHLVGQVVCAHSGAKEALTITNSQHYTVSSFVATPYYSGRHTYIYNAAVAHPTLTKNVVGGIGIVFDSTPQFESILSDTLPMDQQGSLISGSFGVFTDRQGIAISCAGDMDITAGDKLELEDDLFKLECGKRFSKILTFRSKLYMVGMAASAGYREYKTTGDYNNDVLAFIFIRV